MKISIITPAYNEVDNLNLFYSRLLAVLNQEQIDYEWLIVDDCSKDNTFEVAKKICYIDNRVRLIKFSRNLGSHIAIRCGLNRCTGDIAVVLASDLQDPPEIIPQLLAEIRSGANIVWAARESRNSESVFNVLSSRLFYWLMTRVFKITDTPPRGADFFAITRVVISAICQFKEPNINVFMLLSWVGFSQNVVLYTKQERNAGVSGWSFFSRVKLGIDSIIASSYVPIRFMSLLGFLTSFLGFAYAVVVLINWIFGLPVIQGWSSLMIVLLFASGIIMTMLGLLGEYLWRSLEAARARPMYFVEKEIN